jgi:hypothetical protein
MAVELPREIQPRVIRRTAHHFEGEAIGSLGIHRVIIDISSRGSYDDKTNKEGFLGLAFPPNYRDQ